MQGRESSARQPCFEQCNTEDMVANCFTKPLLIHMFRLCLSVMGVALVTLLFAAMYGIVRLTVVTTN